MNVQCFNRDVYGNEIVNFNRSSVDNSHILTIHRIGNTFICVVGLILNVLLTVIITKSPANMYKMRPILWFGVVVDLILASLNFVSSPFANASYGRTVGITNGPFDFQSRNVNGIIMGLVGWIVLTSWICLPCQFVYRYCLVKTGERPRDKKLFFFVVLVIATVFSSLAMAIWFYNATPSKQFLKDVVNILDHDGYAVPESRIHGACDDPRMQAYNLYFMMLMVVTYSIVIFCALKIRKVLRNNVVVSTVTKKLNADMDRVLIFLALTPVLTSIIPAVWISYSLNVCKNYLIANLLTSWLIIVGPVLNAIMTIYFIRPYRHILNEWLQIRRQTTNTSKIQNNVSTSTNFLNITNQLHHRTV